MYICMCLKNEWHLSEASLILGPDGVVRVAQQQDGALELAHVATVALVIVAGKAARAEVFEVVRMRVNLFVFMSKNALQYMCVCMYVHV